MYRDMSGQSLHRRGYRSVMHSASLNEAAAAGCLLLAGWPDAAMTGKLLAAVSLGAYPPDSIREPLHRPAGR